jgi:hypothetical protein
MHEVRHCGDELKKTSKRKLRWLTGQTEIEPVSVYVCRRDDKVYVMEGTTGYTLLKISQPACLQFRSCQALKSMVTLLPFMML